MLVCVVTDSNFQQWNGLLGEVLEVGTAQSEVGTEDAAGWYRIRMDDSTDDDNDMWLRAHRLARVDLAAHQLIVDRDQPNNFSQLPEAWSKLADVKREAKWFRHGMAPVMARVACDKWGSARKVVQAMPPLSWVAKLPPQRPLR